LKFILLNVRGVNDVRLTEVHRDEPLIHESSASEAKERGHLEDLVIDRRIILKWIFGNDHSGLSKMPKNS
jgi:hypothetical protein